MLATAVDLDALGRIGTALADESRRQLLVRLLEGPGYPAELAGQLGLTKANVSNHLACLRGCGLVATTPEGRRVRYELADPRFAAALAELAALALPPADGCDHDRSQRA
jgi:DNA-binding transcriptional ArsR family regulator